MEIREAETREELENLISWATLQIWQIGPASDLGYSDRARAFVGFEDGEPVAYLIAEDDEAWHIEVKREARGNGFARQLVETAQITFAWEVCSDEGASFAEALGIEYEDCR